jgi:Flp pilus assembly pilin Flp
VASHLTDRAHGPVIAQFDCADTVGPARDSPAGSQSTQIRNFTPRGSPTMSSISRFLRSESGATTAEYGIIIVVVAGIAIFVLSQLNGALSTLYDKFNTKVSTVS